ncbi:MAG: nitrophenyl compound nitroreductase subunit ArsF family protein [Candidatus Omnitrophota bacterium]
MKKIIGTFLVVAALISLSFSAFAGDNKPVGKVIAYYFHSTFRCSTCTTMEKYISEVIEADFKDALSSGKLEFKVVNIEEQGNEHFARDYKLYTKSLVLSLVKDGKEVKSENLTKIWEYARDKQEFFDYVSEEVNNFLKETQ